MNNSMITKGTVSFATLRLDTAAYFTGLPCGEMSTEIKPCELNVELDTDDHMTARIEYIDGFPDRQTLNLVFWKPGCAESIMSVQFNQEWKLLEWTQAHMPDCIPTLYELTVKPINFQEDGLQLIGLRTPDLFAIVGCAYPLELGV